MLVYGLIVGGVKFMVLVEGDEVVVVFYVKELDDFYFLILCGYIIKDIVLELFKYVRNRCGIILVDCIKIFFYFIILVFRVFKI